MPGIRTAARMLIGLFTVTPLTAYAQSLQATAGNWAALTNLQSGVQLRVIRNNGKSITGFLHEASDSGIVLSGPKERVSIVRKDVRKVYRNCPGATRRRSMLNLGLLGASTAATVVLARNHQRMFMAPVMLTYSLLCVSRPSRYVLIYEKRTP